MAILNCNEYIFSTNGTPSEGSKLQPVYVIFFSRQTEFGQKGVTFIWLEMAILILDFKPSL